MWRCCEDYQSRAMQFGYSGCDSNKGNCTYNVLHVATVKVSHGVVPCINIPGFVSFELHQQQQLSTQTTKHLLPQKTQLFKMDQNTSFEQDSRKCSKCRKMLIPYMFYRRGAVWKTCNDCSNAATVKRKTETLQANTARYQQAHTVRPGYGMNAYHTALDLRALELQGEYARAQEAFERQQQQQYEMRGMASSTALDYLLSPHVDFEPSPWEMYQQQLRMNGRNTAMHFNQGAGQGMNPVSQDPNDSADFRAFLTELEQMPQPHFDFEEYAANELQGDYIDLKEDESLSNFDEMDVDESICQDVASLTVDQVRDLMAFDSTHQDTTIQQSLTPATPGPAPAPALAPAPAPVPASLSLSSFFTSFRATQDLLRQPESPEHGLTGDALVAHLISEYGLAVRLEVLSRRWSGYDRTANGKLHQFFQELWSIHQMEVKKQCTPWTPLSGWLVIYEQEFNDFATDYELFAKVSWQAQRKYQARKLRLSRQLKIDLRDTFTTEKESSEQELCKIFVELTGRSEHEVKKALQVELQNVARKVNGDCLNNGILFMDQDRFGRYKYVETK